LDIAEVSISAILGTFFKAQKLTIWRSNRVFSPLNSGYYVWQDIRGFEFNILHHHSFGDHYLNTGLKPSSISCVLS
jgi:hypothetical protein